MQHTKILLLLFCLVTLFGCQSAPVQVRAMPKCSENLDPKLLEESCATPTPVKGGEPYEKSLQLSSQEKVQLLECAYKHKKLQEVIKKCDIAAEEYRKSLK